ncbi:MAG: GMC family oxidoreductase [Chrysiogenetes bacterium]|nr:GMC family oxidoreductase [Chrysiogenetes bacterium]
MDFDVIVVGSGFGGSVSAARLAQKGLRVLVLERGPWWGPLNKARPEADRRDYPRGIKGARRFVRNLRVTRGGKRRERLLQADGLYEAHVFDDLFTLTSSGVGGGSHIYTNILEEPPAEFFAAFPEELTGEELHPYFERVREVMRPAPLPDRPEKNLVFEHALASAGLPAPKYPDLAVAWGADPRRPEKVTNAAGIEQRTSTHAGTCIMGCEDGSKTTLDLTYIPMALKAGAKLRPLCEVLAVGAHAGGGYEVRYRDHRTGKQAVVHAPRLVLAAGGLNTQRLLFAARERHRTLPGLPATLGARFSPNADLATLLWKTKALGDSSQGPSFNAFASIEAKGAHRFLVGEVGVPAGALPLPESMRASLRRSAFLFCMGRDASAARIEFDGKGITTTAGREMDRALFDEMEQTVARVAAHYGPERVLGNLPWGKGARSLFTVHPLGGCSIGSSAEDGFTDHRGQVFGHPGLFVADGSLYPRSPGIPPSMSIAALAERQADLMD